MKIKYLGGAHKRVIPAEHTFGGTLNDASANKEAVVFTLAEGHVLEADTSVAPKAFWDRLAKEPDFSNVSDYDEYPSSLAEERWLARTPTKGTKSGSTKPETVKPEDKGPKTSKAEDK